MGGGGKSTSVQEAQYIPGYAELLSKFATKVPGMVTAQPDLSVVPSEEENVLASILSGMAPTNMQTPADTAIQNYLLSKVDLSSLFPAMPSSPAVPVEKTTISPNDTGGPSPMDYANMLGTTDPELLTMFKAYNEGYESQKSLEKVKLQNTLTGMNQDLGSRGRMGSGAQITGTVNAAQGAGESLSNYANTIYQQYMDAYRQQKAYKEEQSTKALSDLTSQYGSAGLANTISAAMATGSVPRLTAEASRESAINDLLLRLGYGTRLAGGFGTGTRVGATSETGQKSTDIGSLLGKASQGLLTNADKISGLFSTKSPTTYTPNAGYVGLADYSSPNSTGSYFDEWNY